MSDERTSGNRNHSEQPDEPRYIHVNSSEGKTADELELELQLLKNVRERESSNESVVEELNGRIDALEAQLGRVLIQERSRTAQPNTAARKTEGSGRDENRLRDTHEAAKRRLKESASDYGTHVLQKTPGTALVLFFAFLVIGFEFFSATAGSWEARVGVYSGLIILLFLLTGRNMELTKRGAMAALFVNGVWWLFLTGSSIASLDSLLSSEAALAIATLLLLPGFIWYLLLLEPGLDVSNKLRGVGTLFITIMFFALVFPQLTIAGGLVPTPPGGFDTREAAGDAFRNIAVGFGGGFENFMCWIGFDASCGFAGWLNEQLSPFSYDATTVHQIRNERLGAYIKDVRTERTIDISGMGPGQFLSEAIEFTIHAPIPPEIERDLCSTLLTIPAFGDLCSDYSVKISCEVEDVSATRIEPRENLTLREVIAQSNTISRCRVQVPNDIPFTGMNVRSSSKQIRIAAEYPFLTTTFKLIRIVDRDALITPEVRRAFDSFSEDSIISAGGPVIITTDENERMAIEDGSTHPITFRLVPQQETRLTSLHVVGLYIPNGMRLLNSGPESMCNFIEVTADESQDIKAIQDEICAEFSEESAKNEDFDRCVELCRRMVGCSGPNCCEDACSSLYYEHETRESLGCRDLASTIIAHFTPADSDSPIRPGSIYIMRRDAISRINTELTEDPSLSFREWVQFWNRQKERDTPIQCTLEVTDKDALLDEGVDVTERTIQAIAAYTVEHAQISQIRFEGQPRITSHPSNPRTTGYIPKGLSEPVPVGVVPYESGKVTITDVFRSRRSGGRLHTGIDLVGASNKNIVSAWDGVVAEVCREGNRCSGGYGNFVLIQSKQGSMAWDHMYSHFSSIEENIITGARVRQGQRLGVEGTTGKSTGNHLHFEVRINSAGLVDPFILIYDPDRFNERNLERAKNNWQQSWDRAVEGPPLVSPAYFEETGYTTSNIDSEVAKTSRRSGSTLRCQPTPAQISTILEAARTYSVPPPIMFAVAAQETNCKHEADEDKPTPSGLQESGKDAIGMFQIVTSSTKCLEAMKQFDIEASRYGSQHASFDFHAHCAANILYDKYLDNLRRHNNNPGRSCGSYCVCTKGDQYNQTGYEGWKAAVKGYHGWGCFDTEAEGKEYENNVENMTKNLDRLVEGSDQAVTTWDAYV
jgi:murein DD-endopeptidase MepM/ murein hydrolase activator NlpD